MTETITAEAAHDLLGQVVQGTRLDRHQAADVFTAVGRGLFTPVRTAALLAALHSRGEEPQEVAGAVEAFRAMAVAFPEVPGPVVDTCGTGGDGHHTINISTAAALVAASMGITVAKHGNRGVSSRCGSADIVAALGLPGDQTPEVAAEALRRDHFTFLHAQRYHPAMKEVGPVRRDLATPTVFNLLGPLLNPAPLTHQLMGVSTPAVMGLVADALAALGRRRALVVHGSGLDEIAVHGPTRILDVSAAGVREVTVTPEDLGVDVHPPADLVGGEARENAAAVRRILDGRGTPAHRDAVAVNAGAIVHLVGATDTLAEGVRLAGEHIDSGAPGRHLDAMTGGEGR